MVRTSDLWSQQSLWGIREKPESVAGLREGRGSFPCVGRVSLCLSPIGSPGQLRVPAGPVDSGDLLAPPSGLLAMGNVVFLLFLGFPSFVIASDPGNIRFISVKSWWCNSGLVVSIPLSSEANG